MIGQAIFTGGSDDDGSALANDLAGGAHPFDRLVQVLVEGEAAVGGDDDVVWLFYSDHGLLAHEFTTCFVCLQEIAGEYGRDIFVFIQRDIE